MKTILTITLIALSISSSAQNKELILAFNEYSVYKNLNDKTYIIKNDKGKVIHKELKYIDYVGIEYGKSLQVLNKDNEILYFDDNLVKIEYPKKEVFGYCGTVAYYGKQIIEDEENYLVEFTEDRSVYNEGIKKIIIDNISKKHVKDIYFANNMKSIYYSENSFSIYPIHIVIDFGDKFGIRSNKSVEYFDSIDIRDPYTIKVEKNKLYGYYGITKEVKFSVLKDFEFNLAKFQRKDGSIGYIDLEGNEY